MPITSGMATSWGLLELVGLGLGLGRLLGLLELTGLGRLLGLLELTGLGRLVGLLGEGAGLPELAGLLELGELPLVGAVTLWVGRGLGVCVRAGGFVLAGVVGE